jgi:hypothetical protein
MKKLIVFIMLAIFILPAFSQQMFQILTDKYADKDGFSATMITSDMFDIYLKKKNIDEESPVFETLNKLDNILVASQSKYGENEDIDIESLHTEILDFYKKGEYKLFKTEKRMGEDIKVYLKKVDNKVVSLSLVTESSAAVNLVEMNGEIDMVNLGELSNALSVRGLENLYKVNGGASYQVFGGTFITPDFEALDFSSGDYFSNEKLLELKENIIEQNLFDEEQREEFEAQAREMAKHKSNIAEKYREMGEKYRRQPIFLSYPGDTNTVYYIDGKKAKTKDIKKLDKDKIESIEVNRSDKKDKSTIRIKTK